MYSLQQYIMTVIAAALICSLIPILTDGTGKRIVQLICGVIMTVMIVSPLACIDAESLFRSLIPSQEAYSIPASGKAIATEAMAEIIKRECEAYILDKAKSLGLSLSVTVLLGEEELPVPKGVIIYGSADEERKNKLTELLEEEFAITEEALQWIG